MPTVPCSFCLTSGSQLGVFAAAAAAASCGRVSAWAEPPIEKHCLASKQLMGMAANLSSAFAKWCQMTCYHGVNDCYSAKNKIVKSIWFVVVVTGCILAVNQSVDFILDYLLEEQWITNVYRVNPPGDRMIWPELTICYANAFDARDWKQGPKMDPYEAAFISHQEPGVDFYDRYLAERRQPDLERKMDEVRVKVHYDENETDEAVRR